MPAQNEALELLSNVDIFSALKKRELNALVGIAKKQTYKPGQIVFRQGDTSDHFAVVMSGVFEVYLWDELLQFERPLTKLRRGEIFGEMGLLTNEARSAFVRAQEAGSALRFSQDDFFNLLQNQTGVVLGLARTLAQRLSTANRLRGTKLENLSRYKPNEETIALLPLQVILRHKVVPVAHDENAVTVAMVDPADLVARNTAAEFLRRFSVSWICVSQPDFENFRDKRLFDLVKDGASKVAKQPEEIRYLVGINTPTLDPTSETARTLDEILKDAIDSGASDLHLEPESGAVSVRARVDGRLIELNHDFTPQEFKPLVSRIKVLADMDITETRLPQDSALRLNYGDRNIDLRISTIPTPRGESVACRLFDPNQRKTELHDLVVAEQISELIRQLFFLPSGLVLVTGPTGSGKTTTLYAGIHARQAHSKTAKLVTAEDPIEYELTGATQVPVKPHIGLTFERILRSLLRQDPDVILVGEIRDKASMEIALEAALTGHLVLSSLHTNDVLETVMRIRQRGVEPYVIASSLRGIVSQRLVPRLCGACAEQISPDTKTVSRLRTSGIVPRNKTPKVWKASGCGHCRMTGTTGRVGVFEVLVMTPSLRDAIEHSASMPEMEAATPAESYVTMRRYARHLLEQGLASAEDLLELFPATSAGKDPFK